MEDIIVIAIVVLIIGAAIGYIIKAKKSGAKCIGCPSGKTCGARKNGDATKCCCGCSDK